MTDKITIDRAVVEQALEALSTAHQRGNATQWANEGLAINALRAALEQPQVEQEPYLWYDLADKIVWAPEHIAYCCNMEDVIPLYENPQPPRQPLTEDGIKQAFLTTGLFEPGDEVIGYEVEMARAIERAHGIGGEA